MSFQYGNNQIRHVSVARYYFEPVDRVVVAHNVLEIDGAVFFDPGKFHFCWILLR